VSAAPAESRLVDAWQAALAAEHRAVFGYGVLGPRLDAAGAALARTDQAAHETLRDGATAAMGRRGIAPQAPAADYPDLGPITTPTQARTVALGLETGTAAAWRYLYAEAASHGPAAEAALRTALRPAAQTALTDSAVRATAWRRQAGTSPTTVAFPGI
jgi:hypothetical protein